MPKIIIQLKISFRDINRCWWSNATYLFIISIKFENRAIRRCACCSTYPKPWLLCWFYIFVEGYIHFSCAVIYHNVLDFFRCCCCLQRLLHTLASEQGHICYVSASANGFNFYIKMCIFIISSVFRIECRQFYNKIKKIAKYQTKLY